MSETFIDIVGYQLEKVHTGVIAWLLDSERSPLPFHEQAAVVEKIAPTLLKESELTAIKATREYSFGRLLRIDLVLELNFNDHAKKYLLIECKVDTDVRVAQLKNTAKAFSEKYPKIPFSTMVLAVGAGQFTLKHQLPDIQRHGFLVVDLPKTLDIFSKLSITDTASMYDDWIASLKAERDRAAQIDKALAQVDHPWDARLLKFGYRMGFPVFYMVYDKVREYLDKGSFQEWAIESGQNNPVMDWHKGWVKVGPKSNPIELYWEFNDDAFCLKSHITEENLSLWPEVRSTLIELCNSCPVIGHKTANRRGTWRTAYKWQFDFCKETPSDIAKKTNDILSYVHKRLPTID